MQPEVLYNKEITWTDNKVQKIEYIESNEIQHFKRCAAVHKSETKGVSGLYQESHSWLKVKVKR